MNNNLDDTLIETIEVVENNNYVTYEVRSNLLSHRYQKLISIEPVSIRDKKEKAEKEKEELKQINELINDSTFISQFDVDDVIVINDMTTNYIVCEDKQYNYNYFLEAVQDADIVDDEFTIETLDHYISNTIDMNCIAYIDDHEVYILTTLDSEELEKLYNDLTEE